MRLSSIILFICFFFILNFKSNCQKGKVFTFKQPVIILEGGLNSSKLKQIEGDESYSSNRNWGYNYSIKGLFFKEVAIGTHIGFEFRQDSYNTITSTNQFLNNYSNTQEYQYNINYNLTRIGLAIHWPLYLARGKNLGLHFDIIMLYDKLDSYKIDIERNNTSITLPLNYQLDSEFHLDGSPLSSIFSFGFTSNPKNKLISVINFSYEFGNEVFIGYLDSPYKNDNLIFNIGLKYKLYKEE